MSSKVVIKIGGSNLKKISSLEKVISIAQHYNHATLMVVSAFFGDTNLLIDLLGCIGSNPEKVKQGLQKIRLNKYEILDHYIKNDNTLKTAINEVDNLLEELEKHLSRISDFGEIPDFLSDKILSYGERLSSFVINCVLQSNGITSKEVLPEEIGLKSNDVFGDASIDFKACSKKINLLFQEKQVYVIPGFYGISSTGQVNLLGRGGTDYSAAAIARLVKADSLDVWKDVNGFLSADPKIVNQPKRIKHLSYSEASELAYFGAKILHPRTIEPLFGTQIPINIFDIRSLNGHNEALTQINSAHSQSEIGVKSITSSSEFSLLKLNGPGLGHKSGTLAKITTKLNETGINIKSVITSQIAINILLSAKDLAKSELILKSLALEEIKEIISLKNIAVVAVVGQGVLEIPGIGNKIFNALAAENINVLMSIMGGSEVVCYLIINSKHEHLAITKIHDKFF